MKITKFIFSVVFLFISSISYSVDFNVQADSEQASAQSEPINWNVLADFGDFYTSFALEVSSLQSTKSNNPFYIGNNYGQIGIEIENKKEFSVLKIRASLSNLIESREEKITLPKIGKYKIYPNFPYNYDQMILEKGPRVSRLSFEIDLNGVKENKEIPIRIRGINDVLLAWKSGNKYVPNKYAFAQYVNENHPAIDRVLRAALDLPVPPVTSFDGYQSGKQAVYNQIFSIWYLLQRNGVTYSSILTPEAISDSSVSQYVRPFGEVLSNRQANCIDGTVFFASILRKIGIDTVIVSRPGHAYLGFYTENGNKNSLDFLETTMLGHGRNTYANSSYEQIKVDFARLFKSDFKMQRSAESFNAAVNEGRKKYEIDRRGLQMKSQGYQLTDIEESRRMGITPLNL